MKKEQKGAKIAGIVGITAAAALAGYLIYDNKGTKAKYNKVKTWVKTAKTDLLKKVKTLKELDREMYNEAVDQIMTKYQQVKGIASPEVKAAIKDLKGYWSTIKEHVSKQQKQTRAKSTKRPAAKKRPAKKA